MTLQLDGDMQRQGLNVTEIIERLSPETQVIFIYFQGVVAYRGITEIVKLLKTTRPGIKTVLVENSQAVTAFSIRHDAENLLGIGFDVLIYGEPEQTADILLQHFSQHPAQPIPKIDGLIFMDGDQPFCGSAIPLTSSLDDLPFPDWESFPLENYWKVGYAHGPMEGPYLPLLTSRGCPVRCHFCVIPSTNNGRWRSRSPKNVIAEIEHWVSRLNVREFHIEDVNPTTNNRRIVDLCDLIQQHKLDIRWKFVAGTKIETMKYETIPILAKAGCTYISFSPETGSAELLRKMNKPFKHDLALKMVASMKRHQIVSQACFVLGYPGENSQDRRATRSYIRKLTLAGLDEIAQFIVTPIPGTHIFEKIKGYRDYSQLTFSPTWRDDYPMLARLRLFNYLWFLFWKALRYPNRLALCLYRIPSGRFKTKMEQALYRVTIWRFKQWRRHAH